MKIWYNKNPVKNQLKKEGVYFLVNDITWYFFYIYGNFKNLKVSIFSLSLILLFVKIEIDYFWYWTQNKDDNINKS